MFDSDMHIHVHADIEVHVHIHVFMYKWDGLSKDIYLCALSLCSCANITMIITMCQIFCGF